jgi:hypothetical protein
MKAETVRDAENQETALEFFVKLAEKGKVIITEKEHGDG